MLSSPYPGPCCNAQSCGRSLCVARASQTCAHVAAFNMLNSVEQCSTCGGIHPVKLCSKAVDRAQQQRINTLDEFVQQLLKGSGHFAMDSHCSPPHHGITCCLCAHVLRATLSSAASSASATAAVQ
eukprot:1445626-Rhodomonas_salina.1